MSYKLTATITMPIKTGKQLEHWHDMRDALEEAGGKVEIDGIDYVDDNDDGPAAA